MSEPSGEPQPGRLRPTGPATVGATVMVGGFGTILYTRDGGKTWIPTAA